MVDLMYYVTNLLLFDIPLLNYYINVRSSMIFCLSSGDIYLSLAISLLCSFLTFSNLFCSKVFETLVILSVTLLPIKSPVASAIFELLFLKEFLTHLQQIVYHDQEVSDCIYHLRFYLSFYLFFCPYFQRNTKIRSLL